jgi:hypothetical protein
MTRPASDEREPAPLLAELQKKAPKRLKGLSRAQNRTPRRSEAGGAPFKDPPSSTASGLSPLVAQSLPPFPAGEEAASAPG